jgi:ribosomal protein S18 acetylase RimI-like enzyme
MSQYIVREYKSEDELNWLDVHASVMVDSTAWWTVIHQKPNYENEVIDLVVEKEDQIAGFITTEINSEVIDFVQGEYGFVWEFGIQRDHRGQGLGKKLIDKTHQLMRERYGINKTIWFTQDKAAQRYYEKLGMQEIERHWQFSVKPNSKLKENLLEQGFNCWNMRGECKVEDFKKVKDNFELIEDDHTLKPRLCIGYSYQTQKQGEENE